MRDISNDGLCKGKTTMIEIQSLKNLFHKHFLSDAEIIVRAPGRVELIGGHTDYNDGYVLPMAIDREAVVLARRRNDLTVRIFSEYFGEEIEFELSAGLNPDEKQWANYPRGVAALLLRAGKKLIGLDMYLSCNVPFGGGLSSSAAIEVAYAKTFLASVDDNFNPVELALLCREAENSYAGAPCGIMDQFISVLARKDHALLLDCRSREFRHIHIPFEKCSILIADTRVKHNLGESEYPIRQEQCRKAVEQLKTLNPSITSLRDVDTDMLKHHADSLDQLTLARARHVVTENIRVLEMARGLEENNPLLAGKAMNQSHDSLRDDYQVSCDELDFTADALRSYSGVYGARMSGGGFGGCVVALIDKSQAENISDKLKNEYHKKYNIEAGIFCTTASGGAGIITGTQA